MKYIIIFYPFFIGALFFIRPRQRWLSALLNLFRIVAVMVFAFFMIRMYYLDIYKIPSGSMEQTLMIGDKIIIRKNALPKHNDIMVFQMKHWKSQMIIVKRCVGLPGDSLIIRQDSVFVNNDYLPEKSTMQWSYIMDSCELSSTSLESLLDKKLHTWVRKKEHFISLSKQEHQLIMRSYPNIILPQVIRGLNDKGNPFPKKKFLMNNKSNYKPFYVPKQGVSIALTKKNVAWYGDIIKLENDSVQIKNWKVSINGCLQSCYTFKDSYYFMMGDNREQSLDSRKWGFVKEEFLIGKVLIKCDSHFRDFTIVK